MSAVTLKAHFDGKNIVPDEPADLPIDTPLAVTVFPAGISAEFAQERTDWLNLSLQNLARAYGDDEPEYTVADLKSRS